MATPIKFILSLVTKAPKGVKKDDYYHTIDEASDEVLFSFKESDRVEMVFLFSRTEYTLEYESPLDGAMIPVEAGKKFFITDPYKDEESAYFPGFFAFNVIKDGHTSRYLFRVDPGQMDYDSVLHLREYVNRYSRSLSLDFEKHRRIQVAPSRSFSQDSVLTSYSFLARYRNRLVSVLSSYIDEEYGELAKREVISSVPGRVSQRSLKWLTEKGHTRNRDPWHPEVMPVRKSVFTLDNPQNRAFKQELLFWYKQTEAIDYALRDRATDLAGQISAQKRRVMVLNEKNDAIRENQRIAKRVREAKAAELERAIKRLHELEELQASYQPKSAQMEDFHNRLRALANTPWLRRVSDRQAAPRVTHKKLMILKQFHNRYITGKIHTEQDNAAVMPLEQFAQKSTPRLFETYTYVMLIRILQSEGFVIRQSGPDSDDPAMILSNSGRLTLTRPDGTECEIRYDLPLEKAGTGMRESGYYTITDGHNCPDFLLSFRKTEDHCPYASLIVECKWRSLKNIWNAAEDTDTVLHLRDYYLIAWYDAENKKNSRGIIQKVITLYPDPDENVKSVLNDDIMFYGLKITPEIEATKGYQELRNDIRRISGLNEEPLSEIEPIQPAP